jgi:hypothetical protein
MKKILIGINIAVLVICLYLMFGTNESITGYVILNDGEDANIVSSVLHYEFRDLEGGNVAKQYITDTEIYLAREDDYIEKFDRLILLDEWVITSDADGLDDYCKENNYVNRKYFYDEDNDGEQENNDEFIFYSVIVDDKGCFSVKLPDEKFVVVMEKPL